VHEEYRRVEEFYLLPFKEMLFQGSFNYDRALTPYDFIVISNDWLVFAKAKNFDSSHPNLQAINQLIHFAFDYF